MVDIGLIGLQAVYMRFLVGFSLFSIHPTIIKPSTIDAKQHHNTQVYQSPAALPNTFSLGDQK
jgi:hypothetical protein